jgi:hypothetical protein
MNNDKYDDGYSAGRHDMREQILAYIYEHHYLFLRKYHGKEADCTIMVKNMIHDIRADQAVEMEKTNEPTQDE